MTDALVKSLKIKLSCDCFEKKEKTPTKYRHGSDSIGRVQGLQRDALITVLTEPLCWCDCWLVKRRDNLEICANDGKRLCRVSPWCSILNAWTNRYASVIYRLISSKLIVYRMNDDETHTHTHTRARARALTHGRVNACPWARWAVPRGLHE